MRSKIVVFCLVILTAITAVFPVWAGEDQTRRILVWQLEAKSGVSAGDVDSLSGYLTSQVAKNSSGQVLSEADIQTVLKGEEVRQRCGADQDTASCMAEVGNALGVDEAVAGDLGKVGGIWILNLRRIDVRRVNVLKRCSRQVKGDNITPMVEALPGAVAELFDHDTAVVPAIAGSGNGLSILQKAAYGTFFSGVALVALGGIGSWQTVVAWDDHKNAPFGSADEQDAVDRHDAWKAVAVTGYVLGGALIATGIGLWIADAVQKKSPEQDKPTMSLILCPGNSGLSVGLAGRW